MTREEDREVRLVAAEALILLGDLMGRTGPISRGAIDPIAKPLKMFLSHYPFITQSREPNGRFCK